MMFMEEFKSWFSPNFFFTPFWHQPPKSVPSVTTGEFGGRCVGSRPTSPVGLPAAAGAQALRPDPLGHGGGHLRALPAPLGTTLVAGDLSGAGHGPVGVGSPWLCAATPKGCEGRLVHSTTDEEVQLLESNTYRQSETDDLCHLAVLIEGWWAEEFMFSSAICFKMSYTSRGKDQNLEEDQTVWFLPLEMQWSFCRHNHFLLHAPGKNWHLPHDFGQQQHCACHGLWPKYVNDLSTHAIIGHHWRNEDATCLGPLHPSRLIWTTSEEDTGRPGASARSWRRTWSREWRRTSRRRLKMSKTPGNLGKHGISHHQKADKSHEEWPQGPLLKEESWGICRFCRNDFPGFTTSCFPKIHGFWRSTVLYIQPTHRKGSVVQSPSKRSKTGWTWLNHMCCFIFLKQRFCAKRWSKKVQFTPQHSRDLPRGRVTKWSLEAWQRHPSSTARRPGKEWPISSFLFLFLMPSSDVFDSKRDIFQDFLVNIWDILFEMKLFLMNFWSHFFCRPWWCPPRQRKRRAWRVTMPQDTKESFFSSPERRWTSNFVDIF